MTDARSARAREILDATHLLLRSAVLSPSGHINFSSRAGTNQMVLTSRGIAYDLTIDTQALVSLSGEIEEGELDAGTQEIVSMHASVYAARSDAQAVLHTHSPFVTAFAMANKPLPCRYEPLLRHGQLGDVPVVPWAPRGSPASVTAIGKTFTDKQHTRAVLLANHGLLALGPTPGAVARLVIVLEEAARGEVRATALDGAKDFPPDAFEQVQRRLGQPRRSP